MVSTSAHAHARTPLQHLRCLWAHWAESWLRAVARDPIATRFTQIRVRVDCTCARAVPFPLFRKPLGPAPEVTQKHAYLIRARSFIAKQGDLLVIRVYHPEKLDIII